jgi:hypothetical protein
MQPSPTAGSADRTAFQPDGPGSYTSKTLTASARSGLIRPDGAKTTDLFWRNGDWPGLDPRRSLVVHDEPRATASSG